MIALIALDAAGYQLARRLKNHFAGARVHGLAGRTGGADVEFSEVGGHLRQLFRSGETIVGVCAAGILIRALGPVLGDKMAEPPVLAVAADGGSVVPLLGGHRGGNRLALEIAALTGGHGALTTAGDVRYGLALDDPPAGWRVANGAAVKAVSARLLAGETVPLVRNCGNTGWLTDSAAPFAAAAEGDGQGCVRVTEKAVGDPEMDVILHPPVLALGLGCERDCDPRELIGLAGDSLDRAGLSPLAVACVVSIDVKMDEPAIHAVAAHLNVPVRFFGAAELEAQACRLANPSDVVFEEVGCHGVAEGAALAAVGDEGLLRAEKNRSKRATCAIGFAENGIDPAGVGHRRGRLRIVGIGPGADEWRTPAATAALAAATDVVGYDLYLKLIEHLIGGKARHSSPLAHEEERVRKALDLAAEGKSVALVCSGDAGIYALATLAFELLDRENKARWNRVDLAVTPGISAFQAAAARIGAPMGHDFCTISLSDLLTPWPEIERRLKAAASGDFVVALYNPVSKRRVAQLTRARDLLLQGRPADTPVALARNLGRVGETMEVITLGELTPGHADMLTMIVIGNSQSRLIDRGHRRWLYTPRGYAAKMAGGDAK